MERMTPAFLYVRHRAVFRENSPFTGMFSNEIVLWSRPEGSYGRPHSSVCRNPMMNLLGGQTRSNRKSLSKSLKV